MEVGQGSDHSGGREGRLRVMGCNIEMEGGFEGSERVGCGLW